MSLLHSLQLQGIRSFNHDTANAQVVEFLSPVTLFLGQNGSGKTTIIESLKYACSGELPPNSDNGKCFVHDPKISGLSSVKGQIKLRFIDARDREITVVKVIQVTQSRDKLQFSSIDHSIKIKETDGTERTLSSRCADLKNVIFEYFGVSRPIINNVIFCQQDNALWPLDDGKKLKEKFDAIFNIGSFNNAVENVRTVIKKKKESLKILAETLKYAKDLKQEVDRKQANLVQKKEEITTLEQEMSAKNEVLTEIHKKINEIATTEQNLSKIMAEVAAKESQKESLKKQQETLSSSIIHKFNGSDEALNLEIQSFEKKCEEDKKQLEIHKVDLEKLEADEKRISDVINKLQVKIGELREKQQQQELRCSKRNELINEMCRKLKLPEQDTFNPDTINKLDTHLQKLKVNVLETQSKHKKNERTIEDNITKYKEERAGTLNAVNLKQQDIKETQKKFREISTKLHDLNVSDEQMNNYAQKITKIEKELESLNKSIDTEAIKSKMNANKEKIIDLEREQEDFEKDRKLLQKNCITENEIESKSLLLHKREAEINKLKVKHHHSFKSLFTNVPTNNFKQTIQNRIVEIENVIKTLRRDMDNQQKTTTRLDVEKKLKNEKYDSLKEKLAKNKETIKKACHGEAYEKYVKDLHLHIEGLQKERGECKSVKIMYEKYIRHLSEEKCCPVCDTGFHDKADTITNLISNMTKKIKRLPEDIKNLEEQLEQKQKEHTNLLQLKSVNDEIDDIEKQLPDIKKEIEEIETELETANANSDNFDEALTCNTMDLKLCNDVVGDSSIIDQYQTEIKSITTDISDLKSNLITVPSNMSLMQIDQKLEDIKEELSTTRKSSESLQKKMNQNNERRQQLTQERNSLVEKQLNLQKDVQGRPLLEDQRIELQKKEETLNETIKEFKGKEFEITKLLAEEKDKLEQLKEANKLEYEKYNEEYTKCQKLFDQIVNLQKEINIYVESKNDESFKTKKEDLCKMKIKEDEFNNRKKDLTQEINDLTRKLDGQSNVFRSLNDNLRLRDLWKEEEVLIENIKKLNEELKDYDHKSIQTEKLALQKRYIQIEKEIVFKDGNLNEIKKSVKDLELDLSKSNNVNAYKNYKRKLLETYTTRCEISDLDCYGKELENAIIKYHANRMRQINMILKDFWQTIYKGNDINYIEIKANESTSNKARRVYNYKVVQYRNDVEMDMSGRCSAGQKVLACLLIRMALAETFSHNCGILALDEPTTNLDRDNIKSLCEALSDIINTRQSQKNFQLLIITHDSYFLDTLKTLGCTEYYYQVARNASGDSIITQQHL